MENVGIVSRLVAEYVKCAKAGDFLDFGGLAIVHRKIPSYSLSYLRISS